MCYMCTQAYRDQQNFLNDAKDQLKGIPLDRFKAGDLPILYHLFVNSDDIHARSVSESHIKALIHRVLGA